MLQYTKALLTVGLFKRIFLKPLANLHFLIYFISYPV